jgi:hypothetical protein
MYRYDHASLLRRVQEIAAQVESPTRIEQVPVASFA